MTAEIYTNTSVGTARRCLTEYDLGYNLQLEPVGVDSEALQVGQTWHKAFHEDHLGGDPYALMRGVAPSPLWNEKLSRLYSAHGWYWESQPLELEEAEHSFRTEFAGIVWKGQIDGIVRLPDGRRGILERKTGSDSLDVGSLYWDRLRLDVQTGLYASACGFVPDFILYDVVRKPTINPKNLSKADVARLGKELQRDGVGIYYAERFTEEQLAAPLEERRESIELYGARLTADIGNRPDYYFARRPVDRTQQDYDTLHENLRQQVEVIRHAQENGLMHRNPDACAVFGRCKFSALCWNNIRPREGDPAPDGFRRREHLHPELAQPAE